MGSILMLLSDSQNREQSEEIFDDLINFGISLLDGGNQEVQKSVFNFFLNYTTSEVFFLRLHEKFEQEITKIRKDNDIDDNSIKSYRFKK